MKKFLSCQSETAPPALIEWDVERSKFRITLGGKVLAEVHDARIVIGVSGEGVVAWQGRNFAVLQHIHEQFLQDYPTSNVREEYLKADNWCTWKKREVKNVHQFMSNWLKRSRGGDYSRGGVKL